jgi:HEAT repeat protein
LVAPSRDAVPIVGGTVAMLVMKSSRKLGRTLRLLGQLSFGALAGPALLGATVMACADENDPQTWVKRLDDPAQKTNAVQRLGEFFNAAMTKSGKKLNDPDVVALLDKIVEPLSKTYVAGGLDEKTRKELIKLLGDMQDPRASPALAKALNDYDPSGKTDEDVKAAALSVKLQAAAGKKVDQTVADALWTVFSKWHASSPTAAFLARDLQDAIMALKDPSWGPKALEKLSAPIDTNDKKAFTDQQTWQFMSTQLLGLLKYGAAAKPLVQTILTPSKNSLQGAATAALLRMPKDAEPPLLAALNGTDPDLKKLVDAYPGGSAPALLCDTLSWISHTGGRDSCIRAAAATSDDGLRTAIAQTFYRFPADPSVIQAFLADYQKTPPAAAVAILQGANARGQYARVASNFYDSTLTDWLNAQIVGAKGNADDQDAVQLPALESAIKLMTAAQEKAVNDNVTKEGTPREKAMYKLASADVDKCQGDAKCYLGVLDQPIQTNVQSGNMTAIKAAWMVAVLGKSDDALRGELVKRISKVSDPAARLAVIQAVFFMAPKGDTAAADEMDKVSKADEEAGNKNAANDNMATVALSLRSRAMP